MKNFNKGAMFGLDARIALAIFGALSVISGAALYSAIQEAKAEKYRQMFNEISKASIAYYLDHGAPMPHQGTSIQGLKSSVLINNLLSSNDWKGPYFPGKYYSDSSFIAGPELELVSGARINMFVMQGSTWSSNTAYQPCSSVTDTDCAEWIQLYGGNTAEGRAAMESLFILLDKKVDSNDGDLDGKIRGIDFSSNDYRVYYKGIARKRLI